MYYRFHYMPTKLQIRITTKKESAWSNKAIVEYINSVYHIKPSITRKKLHELRAVAEKNAPEHYVRSITIAEGEF